MRNVHANDIAYVPRPALVVANDYPPHFELERRRHGVAPALFRTTAPGDHAQALFIGKAKQSRDFFGAAGGGGEAAIGAPQMFGPNDGGQWSGHVLHMDQKNSATPAVSSG